MTPDLLAWLSTAMDAAQRDAEAATPGPWDPEGDDPTDDIVFTICETPDLVGDVVAYTRGQKHQVPNMVHIARHDPAAVLRRIAADRKLIAECEKVLAVEGWEYDDAPTLAEATIRIVAEGYGRTEDETA